MNNRFDFKGALFSLLIWPIFSLIYVFKNIYRPNSWIIFGLFAIFFGITFIIPSDKYDASAYLEQFKQIGGLDSAQFFLFISGGDINGFDYGEFADFFLPYLFFVLSRFSDSKEFLFGSLALIFSYFIYLNGRNWVSIYRKFPNRNSQIFLILLFMLIPLYHINHFRWYTAFMVFIYGIFQILIYNRKSYFLLIFISALIHFSFGGFALISIIFYFLPKNKFFFYGLLIVSFFLSGQLTPLIEQFFIGDATTSQQRALSYASEYYKELIKDETKSGLYILLQYQNILTYTLLSLIIWLDLNQKFNSKEEKKMLYFGLLVFSVLNFGNDIHSFYTRFLLVFQYLASLLLLNYFVNNKISKFHFSSYFSLFAVLIFSIVQIRFGLPFINVSLFFPLLPFSVILNSNVSILDIIS